MDKTLALEFNSRTIGIVVEWVNGSFYGGSDRVHAFKRHGVVVSWERHLTVVSSAWRILTSRKLIESNT